jgi:uncharacterized protein YbbK (DUF523 family)/uncharacterized protein YbgA (DUF1722 family)
MKTRAKKPRVLVSACLLGRKLRYDGAHARDPYVANVLGRHVEWVPICPETECGMPVPREPLRLRGASDSPRMVTVETNKDRTETMRRWAEKRFRELEEAGLCGLVFKARSPSCGISGVKVFGLNGAPPRACGTGIFASAAQARFPLLPAADEESLRDPALREAFIERMYAAMRWRDFMSAGPTLGGLKEFHAAHELLILAHDPQTAAGMDRLIKGAGRMNRLRLLQRYGAQFASALSTPPSAPKNTRALKEALRRLSPAVSGHGADHILSVIEDYRKGHVPFLVPLALLRHYAERGDCSCTGSRYFLNPYPHQLGLRAR